MSNRLSQMDRRLVYKTGLEITKEAGLDPKVVKLTQSTLRLEQQLSTAKTQYIFGVLVNNNGPSNTLFNTEIRLNQQDSFIVSEIAMRLAEPSSSTDTTYVGTTYPSPTIFVAAGEAAALETIYKGFLKITVNNVVVLPSLHTGRFRQVPFAQKATAAANQNGIADDSIDESSDGVSITEPNIVLIGSKNNIIELDLPIAVATIAAAGFTRLILELRGLLAQNSTIIT